MHTQRGVLPLEKRIKKKKTSNNRCYNAVSYDTTGSFGSPGERKGAHLSCAEILEKDWSWFSAVLHTECFTQSRSPINACGIELTELHWKEKRTQGIGDFKSLLQEGQFQVETKILNLWICLLGTGDIYILKGEQITNIRIGTAEHLVWSMITSWSIYIWYLKEDTNF